MLRRYPLQQELSLTEAADPRYADLSLTENRKRGFRVIGGDKGDLHFQGYFVVDGRTVLYKPVLVTTYGDLTEDEAFDIAAEVLQYAYESIGVECVL